MTDTTEPQHESGGFHFDWQVARRYAHFAGGFWASHWPEAKKGVSARALSYLTHVAGSLTGRYGRTSQHAWLLTLGLAGSLMLSTVVTVLMNQWNRWFFDALERRDVAGLKWSVLTFFLIVAAMAAIGVGIVVTRMSLQVRWRQWVVENLITKWLDQQKFYHLNATGLEPPNPEYRISDDTRWATEIPVDLGIGLLTALMGGAAFITILWSVGGTLHVGGLAIPGYMVWCALVYGIAASLLTAWIGRPLVGRVGQKNEAEGYFRFAMMRLRDNAESIALLGGGNAEQRILRGFYDTVVGRWLAIVRSNAHLTWITNATGPMIPIVPLLFATPKYLWGELTLGEVTQLAAAFVQVQQAISWIVDNYSRVADSYASARRIMDIVDAGETIAPRLPAPRHAEPMPTGVALSLDDVTLKADDGHPLLLPVSLTLKRGEAVHIAGASNTGKSTLARILAGLVIPTSGKLAGLPPSAILLLPQKGYLPLGTLAQAITYPRGADAQTPADIAAALETVGLSSLAARLGDAARWDQILSAGDRQRLAIARAIVARPDILIIDDALSSLDGATQRDLIQRLRREIAGVTILSLGQRAAPAHTFDRTLELTRLDHDAMLERTAS